MMNVSNSLLSQSHPEEVLVEPSPMKQDSDNYLKGSHSTLLSYCQSTSKL